MSRVVPGAAAPDTEDWLTDCSVSDVLLILFDFSDSCDDYPCGPDLTADSYYCPCGCSGFLPGPVPSPAPNPGSCTSCQPPPSALYNWIRVVSSVARDCARLSCELSCARSVIRTCSKSTSPA